MMPQGTPARPARARAVLIAMLRVALVVLFLGAAATQVLLPLGAAEIADVNPEVTHLVVPYSLAAIVAIAFGEVVLVIVWRLLTLLAAGEIVSVRARRLLEVATICVCGATVVVAGVAVYLGGFAEANGGGLPLMILGGATLSAAVALVLALGRTELAAELARRRVVESARDMA
ncbi:DUF2975 domain-containing protein [Sanguibacter suarezii]|uniref:DUF2975 domain-containing protein n=1 Tax=Sanguibacter suarezii TaxID=60921 RepID=UPI000A0251A3|nr:DUF2975 domain-containing protein [Sanguibacter suarezii]